MPRAPGLPSDGRRQGLSETQLHDYFSIKSRNQIAGVPGATVRLLMEDAPRQIMVYVDPADTPSA